MTLETPSPPPGKSAENRTFQENGRSMPQDSDSTLNDSNVSRELSPWSARRAITERLGQQPGKGSHSRKDRNDDRSRNQGKAVERQQHEDTRLPPRGGGSRDKSTSPRSLNPKDRSRHTPRERSRERKSKELSADAPSIARNRDASPEPYRKLRDRARVRRRDRSAESERSRSRDGGHSRDERRDRSRDRRRDRSQDKRRDKSRERKRDRSSDRRRDRSRDRRRDRSRDKGRDRDKDRERKRDRSRDRRRDRSRSKGRRSRSPLPYRSLKQRSASTSPPPKRRRRSPSASRSPPARSRKPLPDQEVSFRGLDDSAQPPSKYGGAPPNREKPNFKNTGLLAKAANKVEGTKISLKYHEPAEARKPPSSAPWRIFVFKDDDVVDTIELHTRSCWLLGRAHEVVDYVLEHPSSSGQHAVIQFRYIQKTVKDEFGIEKQRGKVKPYVIDLESSNGTELNGERIETSRYFELRDKDILKFAGSEREYVVMLPPPEK